MSNLLFDTPYWILGALIVVGGALFVVGNNKTDAPMRNIGAGIVGLAILMFVVSWFVDTDEEKCVRRSKELVTAVQNRDWDKVSALMDRRVKLSILNAPGASFYPNKKDLLEGTKLGVERYDVKAAKVINTEVKNNTDYISVDIKVMSEQNSGIGYQMITDWQLDWQDNGEGWLLTEVIAKRVANQGGEQLRRMFPPVGPQPAGPGWGGFGGFGR